MKFPLLEQFPQHSPCDFAGDAAGNAASDAPLFDRVYIALYFCNSIQPSSSFVNAHNYLFERSKTNATQSILNLLQSQKRNRNALCVCVSAKSENNATSRRRMNWERKPKSATLSKVTFSPQKQLLLRTRRGRKSRVPRMIEFCPH